MKRSILKQCLSIAHSTIEKHPQYNFYLHWSFIVQRNKLMGYATNDAGSDVPVHLGYQSRLKGEYQAKRHSEWNCYRRVKGILVPGKSFEIVNIRLNKKGQIKNSQPCSCCFSFLKEMCDCSHCYFTTDEGIWAKTIF
jgi:hypothetical protein